MTVSSMGVLPARSPNPEHGGMDHLHALGDRHDGVGDAHSEIHVEVRFEALADARLHLPHQVLHGMRRDHAECIHQRQRIHVPFIGHAQDQVEHPLHFGAVKSMGKNTTSNPCEWA